MKIADVKEIIPFTLLFIFMLPITHAVAASPTLLQAKQEAEARGYIFFTTHDEIVAMAKKEGKVRVDNRLNRPNYKPLINEFKQKYPFVTDISVDELQGHEAFQRYLLEIKAGQAKGDVVLVSPSVGAEYMPHMMKHDILGMAKHGVLKIDPRMVHPVRRNVIGISSTITVVPYNRKLISDDKVPAKWEDFLKPEFKGKKFLANISPTDVVPLAAAWGLEKTLDFARKVAAQQPAWGSGGTRTTMAIVAGEHPFLFVSTYTTVKRLMTRDPAGNFSYKIVEPVPTRIVDDVTGVLHTAKHPHAALLWLEFLASPEAQKIIDEYEPFIASVFTPGSATAQEIREKKLSAMDWNHTDKFIEYRDKIFAAYGFPKADKK